MTTVEIDALWQALAIERLAHLAYTRRAFSTDDIWELCDSLPRPENARILLSNAMKTAASRRWIAKSDLSVISRRGVSGGRPLNVWLSVPLNATMQDGIEYVVRQKQTIKGPSTSMNLFEPAAKTTAEVATHGA
jgi:hypothetical protein